MGRIYGGVILVPLHKERGGFHAGAVEFPFDQISGDGRVVGEWVE